MKVIIAGSRGITNLSIVKQVIESSGFLIKEVVCGGARGVDSLGKEWAGNKIPVKLFLPDWDTYGNSAGYRRNIEMAKYADALIAIWDGTSKGTMHMIDIARNLGLRLHVKVINE